MSFLWGLFCAAFALLRFGGLWGRGYVSILYSPDLCVSRLLGFEFFTGIFYDSVFCGYDGATTDFRLVMLLARQKVFLVEDDYIFLYYKICIMLGYLRCSSNRLY